MVTLLNNQCILQNVLTLGGRTLLSFKKAIRSKIKNLINVQIMMNCGICAVPWHCGQKGIWRVLSSPQYTRSSGNSGKLSHLTGLTSKLHNWMVHLLKIFNSIYSKDIRILRSKGSKCFYRTTKDSYGTVFSQKNYTEPMWFHMEPNYTNYDWLVSWSTLLLSITFLLI